MGRRMARWAKAIRTIDPFVVLVTALFALAVVLLVAPLAIVFLMSFTSLETLKFPPPGFSFRWYAALLDSPELLRDAATSAKIALATTLLSVLLATPAALVLARRRGRAFAVVETLFMTPVLLPSFSFGLALLMTFSELRIALSPLTIIAGHVVVCTPFVVRTVMAGASRLSHNLTEASLSLGASAFTTYTRITLQLVRPGIVAGGFMAFMLSFDNVPVSLFVSDARTEVLPIRLWYLIFHTLDVRSAAVAGSLVTLTFLTIVIMERATGLTRYVR